MTVRTWCVDLDPSEERLALLRAHLDDEELARAARFLVPRVGRRFTAARGTLREILGDALGVRPAQVRFTYGEHGKPSVPGLWFNLSHSGDRALVGLADRDLGVDLEEVRPNVEFRRLAVRFFSAPEREALEAVPDAELPRAFFRLWTRKEAYLKACGKGLALPLASFAVPMGPLPSLTPMLWAEDPAEVDRWLVRDVDVGEGYVGALCLSS